MDIVIPALTALLASLLTFFSGFGLGTILTPAFMIFFPADLAIGMTAVVHFFNNLFKLLLTGKYADRDTLFRFGIPAVIAALAGSWLMVYLTDLPVLFSYDFLGRTNSVSAIKLTVSVILILVALTEILPSFDRLAFDRSKLPLGGLLSGFFGGLTGNQGALRSAFLIKAGLSKEAFIGTAVVVSTFVDLTRLSIYSRNILSSELTANLPVLLTAIASAICGAWLGNTFLKKITLQTLKTIVTVMLILLSLAMGSGML